jgi:hypothetical protein
VPYNPYFGDFHRTNQGLFEFEYFINPWDYWYGTYHIWIDRGTEGGPYGEAGFDGLDTYLMLYLDPDGWYEDRFEYKGNATVERSENELRIEVKEAGDTYVIEMKKTNVSERPALLEPKFLRD